MNTARATEDIEFIKLPEVRRITGMGTTFIYEKAKQGEFPRQVKLGTKSVAWIRAEVQEWANAQIAAARGQS
ncbi:MULTISPECIES: helix-turn-helix transcriptional regulator [Pseudomonas]|uniref:helix-turn-helix transcriptional regulator n=1 Tax=Pseudomonas TaxID=286 RepID=UPI0008113034|nr:MULTISPECIES: AlpA family phage regulatory protein [Pseudomonas]ATR83993.1 AlpA family phage regulatory protein [Pseudomonas sp. HLS-6]